MRQTIQGAVIGALVAAGVSVLLAQSATWTTPRNWATDDLLTATDFNSQFRDNLLWLRQDAQLTGTAALEDLGCGTLGTNEVLFSDCSWATIPAGVVFDIHDDVGTAETIVDSDRMVFSDESGSGDPMRFTTAANLANYMQVEVELSANRVTSDTFNIARIPTIPTNSLANDAVTQAKIANNAVGVGQLKLGTGSYTLDSPSGSNQDVEFNLPRYAYVPRMARTIGTGRCDQSLKTNTTSSTTTSRILIQMRDVSVGDRCLAEWDYATSSDTPSVWALVQDSDGMVVGLFEAEDPAGVGAPFSSPLDDDGNPLPGYTAVDVGIPSLATIQAVYTSDLTADQRTAALSCTGDYVMGRGWLSSFSGLPNLSNIPARYEPSGRQWAMRCAAQSSDEAVTAFYLDNMVVDAGVWVVAP